MLISKELSSYTQLDTFLILLTLRLFLLLGCYGLLFFASEFVLISDNLIYQSLGSQLSYERITEMLEAGKQWKWLSYVLLPIILLLKLFFVAVCFAIGALVLGIEGKFKEYMRVAITAEFVLLLIGVIKLFWFSLVQTNYTLESLQYFAPLSVFSLFNIVEPWLVYPLQLLNVFELAYWCVLAYCLKDILERKFSNSLGFVASTYGVGLLLWVVLVMFLTVSMI